MNNFKEWLSDNLRYLLLLLFIGLGILAIFLGVRVVSRFSSSSHPENGNEAVTETGSGMKTEVQTETETGVQTEAQAETEAQTGAQTEAQTETGTRTQAEAQTESGTGVKTEAQTESGNGMQTETQTETGTQTEAETVNHPVEFIFEIPETETETEKTKETETERETEEIDTLKVLTGRTMYTKEELNIRSGPGTEFDVIGYAGSGEEVIVTGRTASWYRVRVGEVKGYVSQNLLTDEYTPDYRVMVSTCYLRCEPD